MNESATGQTRPQGPELAAPGLNTGPALVTIQVDESDPVVPPLPTCGGPPLVAAAAGRGLVAKGVARSYTRSGLD